jgi:hypothetical protein
MIHGARDRLVVKVTVAKDGVGYGPITETWDVALDGLKGTVYYGSYGTEYASSWVGIGSAVLALHHGASSPTILTSSTKCQVCHSVAAFGSDMVTASTDLPGYDTTANSDVYYDLKKPAPPGTSLQPDVYIWGALVPDGSLLFTSSSPMLKGATSAPSAVYSLPSDKLAISSDQISTQLGLSSPLGGSIPEFSPDGKHVVFTFYKGGPASDATYGDARSLAVLDFDQKTSTFSNLRTIYTPKCTGCVAAMPFFTPTSDAIVFEVITNPVGDFAYTAVNPMVTGPCSGWDGAQAELWWMDLATKTPRRLDTIDGLGYLPTGPDHHDDDGSLQYDPSVMPLVSGGYIWVAFMSRRLYGNVAVTNPWCSGDIPNLASSKTPLTKKLWIAAFDLNAKPGSDPSHAAFYLPGQEILPGNFRAFWVRDPCKNDGSTCATGDECCGGHCAEGICQMPKGCSGEGDVCLGSGDCCAGHQCIAGHCDVTIN